MKPVLQIFPTLLLLLGLGLGHQMAPAILKASQELADQLSDSDSWEEAAEDMDVTKAMEPQEAGENGMLLWDSLELSLAEAFLREKEMMGKEEAVAKELVHAKDMSYLRQVQFNKHCNGMMAQKARQPNSVCKAKHSFIHENLHKVKAICTTPSIPCKERGHECHQSSEPLKSTICQLTGDIVFPSKDHYQSSALTVMITIACDLKDPESLRY
ncbi:inactive ribonuclease-like protein 10 [Trichosurus vulpecula]|uniref:inactive ribonuclease-like protein 10 n=1 Tax=Trichosurus vulpecula TaxID=9337 RepID=UPI00186AFCF3|nr:inactive ribonuclease-like protein 10 [Trichosurus vulpecula]